MTLPISNVVNVSISLAALAAGPRSFGSLLILGSTTGVIDTIERMREYSSIKEVAEDYGVDDPEYASAKAYFGQAPKPRTLYIGFWNKAGADPETTEEVKPVVYFDKDTNEATYSTFNYERQSDEESIPCTLSLQGNNIYLLTPDMDIDFTYYIYKTDDTVYMYSIDYSSNEIIEDITNNGGNMAEQVLKTTNDSLRKKIAEQ